MAIDIDSIHSYQEDLRVDYIIKKELANLAGNMALKYGQFLAMASGALIMAKHINFDKHLNVEKQITELSSPIAKQSSPTAD